VSCRRRIKLVIVTSDGGSEIEIEDPHVTSVMYELAHDLANLISLGKRAQSAAERIAAKAEEDAQLLVDDIVKRNQPIATKRHVLHRQRQTSEGSIVDTFGDAFDRHEMRREIAQLRDRVASLEESARETELVHENDQRRRDELDRWPGSGAG
jgi:polyhydroxyalkanoate synthesis regulator phasin